MSVALQPELSLRCAIHSDIEAVGTCGRCGSFYCGECAGVVGGRRFCRSCLSVPGVDYLRDLRERCWGKRDGWVWFNGFVGAIVSLAGCASYLATQSWFELPLPLLGVPVSSAYFMLKPAARLWLFASYPVALIQLILRATQLVPEHFKHGPISVELAMLALGLLFTVMAYRSTRNRLAFKLEVSELELENLYWRVSNATATRALVYGLLAPFVPMLGLFTLALGWHALGRADRDAWPPVRGRGRAIAGMILSVFGLMFWGIIAIVVLRR